MMISQRTETSKDDGDGDDTMEAITLKPTTECPQAQADKSKRSKYKYKPKIFFCNVFFVCVNELMDMQWLETFV